MAAKRSWLANTPIFFLLRETWVHAEGRRGRMVGFIALSLLGHCLLLTIPLFIGRAFDTVQFRADDPRVLRQVLVNIGLMFVVAFVFQLIHASSRVIETTNAFFVEKHYRERLFRQVLSLPMPWHRDHHSGDTLDKVAKATGALRGFAGDIFGYISIVARLIGSIGILLYFDWRAGAIAVGFSAVMLLSLRGFDRAIQKSLQTIFRFENALAAALFDTLSNIRTVLTLRLTASVEREVATRGARAYPETRRNRTLNEVKWSMASLAIALMTVVILSMNAYSSYQTLGIIQLSTLFLLYQYLSQVGDVFFDIAWRYGTTIQQDSAVRAADVLTDAYDALVPRTPVSLPAHWQTLAITDLSFRYPEDSEQPPREQRPTLSGVALTIPRGARIAFIGESGSGKSTLLALLRGLDEPHAGVLAADGVQLPDGLAHLASHVTLIPQEPELFNSTVEANITMDVHRDPALLERAIDLAQFRSVLPLLPHGMETNVLEKGVSLSGGQKQRLALARGILAAKDSDILLLDEPTSSVDPANERAIYEGLFAAFPEKTILAALHRLTLLELFDTVVLLAGGKAVIAGTPHQVAAHPAFEALKRHAKDAPADPAGAPS